MSAWFCLGPDQRITSGPAAIAAASRWRQASRRKQAEYMTAPERFAEKSDSLLHRGRRPYMTHSGLSGTDFAAMQQAALVANREVQQATESFINNVYNRRHWIAVTGRTIDHCETRYTRMDECLFRWRHSSKPICL